jgi:hypothetical protein
MAAHVEAPRTPEPSAPLPPAEVVPDVAAAVSADAVEDTPQTFAPSAPESTDAKPEAAPAAAEAAEALQSAIAAALPAQTPLRAGSGSLESTAGEAERLARLRYNALVSALAVVFGLAIVAGLAVVFAVIGDAEWQLVAIAGGLEALAVVALVALLMFLEHEPLIQAAPTSTEMAQLETARTYMNKSFEFWEKYLTEREDGRPVTAEDVAMAVSSLTAASHNLLDLEAGLAKASAKPKETPREPHRDTMGPTSPTRPTPVRSRPSRY